jgi:hypothetical protein
MELGIVLGINSVYLEFNLKEVLNLELVFLANLGTVFAFIGEHIAP